MTAKPPSLSSIVGLMLLGAAAWLIFNPGSPRGSDEESTEVSEKVSSTRARREADSNQSHSTRQTNISAKEFTRLKKKLAIYNDQCTGWISPEFESFIEGLLTDLQFTPEMLEILTLVESREYSRTKRGIYKALKLRLLNPESTAARRSFVAVAGDAKWSQFSMQLCWFTGEGCSSEELESLQRQSADPVVGRNLKLGHNLRLVATDPVAAIDSTMGYFKNSQTRTGSQTILGKLFQRLPADSDFETIDNLLPASTKKNDEAYFRLANLLGAWGRADPAAGANYAINDLERFSPELMSYVVAPYARDHTDKAMAWVKEFPPGAHSDVAISAVVDQIADTRFEEARELAARIGDVEMRNKALKTIDIHESGVR